MTNRADHFQQTAAAHNVPASVFRADDKRHPVVAARRELIHRLCVVSWAEAIMAGVDPKRAKELHSLPRVGMWVNKDHTTCLYALRIYSAKVYGTREKATLLEMRLAYLATVIPSMLLGLLARLSEIRDAYMASVQTEQVAA